MTPDACDCEPPISADDAYILHAFPGKWVIWVCPHGQKFGFDLRADKVAPR